MSAGNLEELGKAFVELGELLQDKRSTISELADAADKCGIRLGLALTVAADEAQQPTNGADRAEVKK
jgi:hypothetical protein